MAAKAGHDELDDRLQHRMLFFTDAVFAIVLTILVLELKPPESWPEATPETLLHAAPHIGAFIFSFFIGAVFWAAHMNITRGLLRFDWLTAIANLGALLPVCLLPYATAWIGADLGGAFAWSIYCWVMVAISIGNLGLVLVAYRGGGRLIQGGAPKGELAYRLARAAAPGIAFGVGLILLASGLVTLAHFCALLIPLVFLAAGRFLRPKPAAP
ncbi:TMEM175 family protein [Phenylobacterium sp.]|jgi:hypothetical protein|uniref:TMEM175 family protein n=1 Tax=Phenylobacterium sp. TaxID=1871053 RepID=UPI002F91E741